MVVLQSTHVSVSLEVGFPIPPYDMVKGSAAIVGATSTKDRAELTKKQSPDLTVVLRHTWIVPLPSGQPTQLVEIQGWRTHSPQSEVLNIVCTWLVPRSLEQTAGWRRNTLCALPLPIQTTGQITDHCENCSNRVGAVSLDITG